VQIDLLVRKAVTVVDMYDQANTGRAVKNLGTRGILLDEAIEELREILNRDEKRTILTAEQRD
jgi:hypothetical protein